MTEDLSSLGMAVNQAAAERGLAVFECVFPREADMPIFFWEGDWHAFLDIATQAHTTLLYVSETLYDPQDITLWALSKLGFKIDSDEEESNSDETPIELLKPPERGSSAWLQARIMECLVPWDSHLGEVARLSCVWVKEGIAHACIIDGGDWVRDCFDVVDAVVEEAKQVRQENRVLRSREDALKLHEYATQLARHPRFPEATNDEKRLFMAEQLFPDVHDSLTREGVAQGIHYTTRQLAERAALIYWWDIAPMEQATKIERAQELYTQGESIKNIAALVKLSEAKVRAAVLQSP